MISVLRGAMLAMLLLGTFVSGASARIWWIPANGQWCGKVCHDHRREPVSTGPHTADPSRKEYFFVCAADMNGWRPGYNLRPDWDHACFVPFGGKEVAARNYTCACE